MTTITKRERDGQRQLRTTQQSKIEDENEDEDEDEETTTTKEEMDKDAKNVKIKSMQPPNNWGTSDERWCCDNAATK